MISLLKISDPTTSDKALITTHMPSTIKIIFSLFLSSFLCWGFKERLAYILFPFIYKSHACGFKLFRLMMGSVRLWILKLYSAPTPPKERALHFFSYFYDFWAIMGESTAFFAYMSYFVRLRVLLSTHQYPLFSKLNTISPFFLKEDGLVKCLFITITMM